MKKLDQSYIDFLYKNYGNMSNNEIAKILNKSTSSIRTYAHKLGLKKEIWTQKEIDFLITNYKKWGPQKCSNQLKKTYASVQRKATKLKLCKPSNRKWSKDEINTLLKYYPVGGVNLCNLNRSDKAIRKKAYKLGLKCESYHHQHVLDRIENGINNFVCRIHGRVEFYIKPSNQSLTPMCKKCICEDSRKRYKKSYQNYKYRYINRIRSSFNRLMRTNGYSKSKKFMYDSQQLYQHLEDIRLSQKNQCPMCKISYDVINRDIDHIIPICTAKTIEDINRLFQLSNLTLLCWKCNRHVKGGNYKCL